MDRRFRVRPSIIDDLVNACSVLPVEPVGPHLSDEELILYITGQLGTDETGSVDEHLSTCDECCDRIERLLEGTSRWSGVDGDRRLTAIQGELRRCFPSVWWQDLRNETLTMLHVLANYARYLNRPVCAAWAASLALVLLSIGVLRSSIVNQQPILTQITRNLGLTRDPAVSTDGKELVYAATSDRKGDLDIWLETVPISRRIRLTTDPANDYSPSVSHDLVAFRSDRSSMLSGLPTHGGIYTVSTSGGPETLVVPGGYGPRLSPDAHWLTYWTGDPAFEQSQLYVMPSGGGPPQRICEKCYAARNAIWSSDGTEILFWGSDQDSQSRPAHVDCWASGVLDGKPVGAPKQTKIIDKIRASGIRGAVTPEVWQDDWVYFSVHGPTPGIWKIRISAKTYLAMDEIVPITRGNPVDSHISLARQSVYYSVSTSHTNIWAIPVDTGLGKVIGKAHSVTSEDASNGFSSVSNDGTKLAFVSDKAGQRGIWIQDLGNEQEKLLARSDFAYDAPKISPDGSFVAYASLDAKQLTWNIKLLPTDTTRGGGAMFLDTGTPVAWSPDGGLLLYTYNDSVPSKPPGAGILDVRTGNKTVFQEPNVAVFPNSFSPDGRWVAFHTRVGPSQRKIWIARLNSEKWPDVKEWISIIANPSGTDMEARWAPNGRLLYFLSDRDGHRCVWAQRLDPESGRAVGQPFAIGHFHSPELSIPIQSPAWVGLSVLPDKLLLAIKQTSGNIWSLQSPNDRFHILGW
jgi:eukaryotic-like serine/threonine-protein kinase